MRWSRRNWGMRFVSGLFFLCLSFLVWEIYKSHFLASFLRICRHRAREGSEVRGRKAHGRDGCALPCVGNLYLPPLKEAFPLSLEIRMRYHIEDFIGRVVGCAHGRRRPFYVRVCHAGVLDVGCAWLCVDRGVCGVMGRPVYVGGLLRMCA